ncbi:hypothetical protein FGS76_18190 [Alloalcanivorax gelatiniphagus]|uniref:Lipoprotein n=1 Tax=Alloalcanivorax gelatiniphagus TaxID=1194167 RepID=A0ABY2XI23_9GAMM|nr:hypothetical protein FGS76_18190 [Alloalcanivorax gelatiniphagus]
MAGLLALMTLLAACSQSPDGDVVRDALNRELQDAHLNELLEVTEVEVVKTYPQEDENQYTLDVLYTLEARQGLSEYTRTIKQDEERNAMDRFAMIMALAAVRVEFGNFEAGDTFRQERRLDLQRGEDGWRIPRPGK